MAALRQLRHVFKNQELTREFKLSLVVSLLDSRLFYGASSWPHLRPAEQAVLDRCRVQAFRVVLSMSNDGLPHGQRTTDAEVLLAAGQPSTQALVSIARLRYLQRFLLAAPRGLRALVQSASSVRPTAANSWHGAVVADLAWLQVCMPSRLEALPPPGARFAPWQAFVQDAGHSWKVLLAGCAKSKHALQEPQRPMAGQQHGAVAAPDGDPIMRCHVPIG